MNIDFAHPLPRYGLAFTLVESGLRYEEAPTELDALAKLATSTLGSALSEFLLYTRDPPLSEATTKLNFEYFREHEKLEPGSKSGQNSANGYYLAPHVVASDKTAGGTVKAVRSLREALQSGEIEGKEEALKRSFAPLTAKLNNGSPSLTEQKTSLLEAAFTAIGTLASAKPAAYVITTSSNFYQSIIPDLPLHDPETGHEPLLDFVRLFKQMQSTNTEKGLMQADVNPDDRKYKRPRLHRGNYPNAPQDASLGAIGLVGAIGAWAREGGMLAERYAWAKRVLHYLARNPLYLVSYDKNTQQAQFGHHIVKLALNHDVPRLLAALYRSDIYNSNAKTWTAKASDPSWKLFRMMAGRFLQLFTPASFRDFLAFRAQYDASLSPIFEEYFMSQTNISREHVESARAYGAWLNYVAYTAAKAAAASDKAERKEPEHKRRALVQLESTVFSAKRPTALLSQLNVTAGRLSSREVDPAAVPFMEAVAAGEIPMDAAKELITAFMRVSTYQPKEKAPPGDQKPSQEEAGESDAELFASGDEDSTLSN